MVSRLNRACPAGADMHAGTSSAPPPRRTTTVSYHPPGMPSPAGARELAALKTYIQDKAHSLLELTTE